MTAIALHSIVDGPDDGPVLLLGPSLGTSTELWRDQVPILARTFRVVRYDHRGHGRSPVPPPPYALADLGGDVLALMDRHGISRAHLAGVSLGGMVSMWLAANAPDRVDRLAVICSSARLGPPQQWSQRAALVREQGLASIAGAVVGRWLPAELVERDPGLRDRLQAMLLATPAEGYAACCGVIEQMDLEPSLSRISAPTLVVGGLADDATPPSHAKRIAAGIAGSRLTLLAGAAHLPNVACPDVLARLLAGFLLADLPEESR